MFFKRKRKEAEKTGIETREKKKVLPVEEKTIDRLNSGMSIRNPDKEVNKIKAGLEQYMFNLMKLAVDSNVIEVRFRKDRKGNLLPPTVFKYKKRKKK